MHGYICMPILAAYLYLDEQNVASGKPTITRCLIAEEEGRALLCFSPDTIVTVLIQEAKDQESRLPSPKGSLNLYCSDYPA